MASPPPPAAAALPTALRAVLDHPLTGLARVELDHRLAQRFRWMVLVELGLALALSICALPVLAVLVVLGSGGDLPLPDLDALRRRAWVRWRETAIRGLAGDGSTAISAQAALDDGALDRVLGALLTRAADARVTVVERIEGGPPTALWFGGQPLLQPPTELDEAHAQRVLAAAGARVETGSDRLELALPLPQPSRVAAILGLVLLAPLALWTAAGRARLGELWDAAQGQGRARRLTVDADGLAVETTGGGGPAPRGRIDRKDLLGIGWGPVLGPAPAVLRRGPLLRLATRQNVQLVSIPGDPNTGEALRVLLTAAAQRLWHATGPSGGSPAHCPYCATLYPFAPGASCPSCGAPPLALHGLPV